MPLSDRKRKEGDVTPGKGGKKKRRTDTRRGQCRVLASSVGRCPDMNVQDGYGRSPERQGELPWAGKIPWRRKWQPTPVFLPGESYGQRSLVGHGS